MIFNQYPYLSLNDLNLDYIMKAIKEMRYEVTNFVSINAIKYADPIQWNITSQYEKNTIVIDPVTGTAYISVAPVPAGVALTRPEYWTVVFDLGSFVTGAAQNFTSRWESETTTTATFNTNTGEWLVWGDVLYKALSNIIVGDTYVVGSNIEHFTIEDLYNAYLNTIASILSIIGDLDDLTTTDKSKIVAAINSNVTRIEILEDDNFTTPERFGAIGDGVTDDTAAIRNAMASNHGGIIFGNKTYKITGRIASINKKYILGFGSELYLESSIPSNVHIAADNLNDIVIEGIKFTSNKVDGDNMLIQGIYCQYAKNITIRNCQFVGLSSGIGFFDSSGIVVNKCVFEDMWQFPADAPLYATVYGYGVVLNACADSFITENIIGTVNKPVERHAVYVSNTNASGGAINTSNRVVIANNIINQIIYDNNTAPLSNREFCVKIIDGYDVEVTNNIASGGFGFLQIAFDYGGSDKVSVSNNQYKNGKGFIFCSSEQSNETLKKLYINNNHALLSIAFSATAFAILSNNIEAIYSSNNIYEVVNGISTAPAIIEGTEHTSNPNYHECNILKSTDDIFKNFFSVASLYHVDDFDYDSRYNIDDTTRIDSTLFSIQAGSKQNVKYQDDSTYFDFKRYPSLVINNTIYRDTVMGIIKITKSGAVTTLYDTDGITVGAATRPTDYPAMKPFYDYTNNIVIYKTQFGWYTVNTRYADSYTKAELLALTPPGYSRTPLYCRDTHQPYWFDAYSNVWRDASGVQLT